MLQPDDTCESRRKGTSRSDPSTMGFALFLNHPTKNQREKLQKNRQQSPRNHHIFCSVYRGHLKVNELLRPATGNCNCMRKTDSKSNRNLTQPTKDKSKPSNGSLKHHTTRYPRLHHLLNRQVSLTVCERAASPLDVL